MFQFTGLAASRLWIQRGLVQAPRDQRSFDNSPGLIAVFHALLRLLTPRHPPCALSSLATSIQSSLAARFRRPLPSGSSRRIARGAITADTRWPPTQLVAKSHRPCGRRDPLRTAYNDKAHHVALTQAPRIEESRRAGATKSRRDPYSTSEPRGPTAAHGSLHKDAICVTTKLSKNNHNQPGIR